MIGKISKKVRYLAVLTVMLTAALFAVPVSVSAETVGDFEVTGGTLNEDYSYENSVLSIISDKKLVISNTDPDTPVDDRILIVKNNYAHITLSGVNINAIGGSPIEISDGSSAEITLADGTENFLIAASSGYAGLRKIEGGALIINGKGYLKAVGNTNCAGIGGGVGSSSGNISIYDCTVYAEGGSSGAGIGSGCNTSLYNLLIENANVTAKGKSAAGIGGDRACENVIIKNSIVNATGGEKAAGIGGGYEYSVEGVTIIDSIVTATGGVAAAGIGGGYNSKSCSEIIIEGGSVKATGTVDNGCFPADIGTGRGDGATDGKNAVLKNTDGEEVYLLKIDNPNGERVLIDGEEYPVQKPPHSDDTLIYVYLTGKDYTVKIGDISKKLYFNEASGTFDETEFGKDFVISGINLKNGVDYTYPAETGVLTILSSKNITVSNAEGVDVTSDRIVVANGVSANVFLNGVNIDTSSGSGAAFEIEDNSTGNVIINLVDKSVNSLVSADGYAGIQKNGAYTTADGKTIGKLKVLSKNNSTATLTIKGGSSASGIGGSKGNTASNIYMEITSVDVKGGSGGAGIGGGSNGNGTNISIYGNSSSVSGSIHIIEGGENAAGIGGGENGDGNVITLSKAAITAIGHGGAGIGGGKGGNAYDINLNGSAVITADGTDGNGAGIGGGEGGNAEKITVGVADVTAKGGKNAAGIGGGDGGSCTNVDINFSKNNKLLYAEGGENGAGIGGGKGGSCIKVRIYNSTVTAKGGKNAAGIGGGDNGSCSDITIYYSSVKTIAGENANNIGGGAGQEAVEPLYNNKKLYYVIIENPNGTYIRTNNENQPTRHGDEKRVYLYIPGEDFELELDGELTDYKFYTDKFLPVPKAKQFVFTAPGYLTYDRTAKQAVFTSTEEDMGEITVRYYKDDVQVAAEDVAAAGTYTVKIDTAVSDSFAEVTELASENWTFTVEPMDMSKAELTVNDVVYNREEQKPECIITYNGTEYKLDEDFTLEYSDNINVGTATVKATGKGSCINETSTTFEIMPASIADAEINVTGEYTYNGKAITPEFTVKLGDVTLKNGTEYTVELENNINAGQATITVTGIGNYTDSASTRFTVKPASIADAEINVTGEYIYNRKAITPEFTVKLGSVTLKNGTEYTVELENNINAGQATITVTGIGNYTDSASTRFTVKPASIADAEINVTGEYTYNGKEITPVFTVKLGDVTLKNGTEYTVELENNINAGQAVITVTGIGNYTDSASTKFTVKPASIANAMIDVTGEYTYNGKEITPEFTVKLGDVTLKNGTEYTVEFENNINAGQATITVTGIGNYTDSASTKFTVKPASIADAEINVTGEYTYNGKEITPVFTVKLGDVTLKNGTEYTVELENNINAGQATITVTGIGNYTDSASTRFTVKPASIANAVIDVTGEYTYNGKEISPEFTVKLGDVTLKNGTEYTVELENNINAGQATITVTGIGNYTDSASEKFTIGKAAAVITVKTAPEKQSAGKSVSVTAEVISDDKPVISVYYSINGVKKAVADGSFIIPKKTAVGTVIEITASVPETDNYLSASETVTLTVCRCEHTGGKASCTEQAVCDSCGEVYGSYDKDNHLKVSKEWSDGGTYHYHKCADCGGELDKAEHTGGKAGCTEQAVCEICKFVYGDTTGHSWSDSWSGNETHHWHECENCSSEDNSSKDGYSVHVYDRMIVNDNTLKKGIEYYYSCECGAVSTTDTFTVELDLQECIALVNGLLSDGDTVILSELELIMIEFILQNDYA